MASRQAAAPQSHVWFRSAGIESAAHWTRYGPGWRRRHKAEDQPRLNLQLRLDFSSAPTGEAWQAGREDTESSSAVSEPERPANTRRIMEGVCERANLKEALRQVRSNKGSAGVDGMTVDQLGGYLKQHWPAIREQLLNRTNKP